MSNPRPLQFVGARPEKPCAECGVAPRKPGISYCGPCHYKKRKAAREARP